MSDINLEALSTRAAVKLYLNNVSGLNDVENKIIRKRVANACYEALSKFSSRIKHHLNRKSTISKEQIVAIMNWKPFHHIHSKFKGVNSSARRCANSRTLEKAVLRELLQIIGDC